MKQNFNKPGELVHIKRDKPDTLKIIGYKHEAVKIQVQDFIEKLSHNNYPPEWEEIDKFIVGKDTIIIKDVAIGSPEW